jgi:serine/threonine protein phosphatase PrpC
MKKNEMMIKDRSGSCACLVMSFGDMLFIANVGDSRAIMSANDGNNSYELSKDHKPGEDSEKRRITQSGG